MQTFRVAYSFKSPPLCLFHWAICKTEITSLASSPIRFRISMKWERIIFSILWNTKACYWSENQLQVYGPWSQIIPTLSVLEQLKLMMKPCQKTRSTPKKNYVRKVLEHLDKVQKHDFELVFLTWKDDNSRSIMNG